MPFGRLITACLILVVSVSAANAQAETETVSLSLNGGVANADYTYSTDFIDFGPTEVGSTSPVKVLSIIANEGLIIATSEAPSGDFELISHNCPVAIPITSEVTAPFTVQCELQIAFSPSSEGDFSQTISTVSDAVTQPDQVTFVGIGYESGVQTKLQELYVGILGRAGDRPGLDYWLAEITAGHLTLENTRAAFTDPAQAEYTEIYGGLSFTQLVIAIYENFLERTPEEAGLIYWVDELTNGRVNADQMINAIINAVQDPGATGEQAAKDLATLTNKIAAAIYFTERTKEFPFDMSYRTAARAAVANVTDDPETLDQSKAATDQFIGIIGNSVELPNGVHVSSPAALNPIVDFTSGTVGLWPENTGSQMPDTDVSVGLFIAVHENPSSLSIDEYYDGDPGVDLSSAPEITVVGGHTAYRFNPANTLGGDIAVVVPLDNTFLFIVDHGAAFQSSGEFEEVLNSVNLGE